MLAIESIDGIVPAVQPLRDGFAVQRSDLLADGSGRSAETGEAIRYLIRKGVFRLNLKFKGSISEIAQVDGLVSRFSQTVKFNYLGTPFTVRMYPGDRNISENGMTAELTVSLIQI
jgi:hypothetical protein